MERTVLVEQSKEIQIKNKRARMPSIFSQKSGGEGQQVMVTLPVVDEDYGLSRNQFSTI